MASFCYLLDAVDISEKSMILMSIQDSLGDDAAIFFLNKVMSGLWSVITVT